MGQWTPAYICDSCDTEIPDPDDAEWCDDAFSVFCPACHMVWHRLNDD